MSDKVDKIFIEENKRFSELAIWKSQKAYYDSKGIEAWADDVPFYITSNPFIGRSYAKLALAFIQDWILQNKDADKKPFYILEMGTGSGQFSFYFLRYLTELLNDLNLQSIQIKYIMSDVTSNSFDFWEKHPALKPFLDSGVLDFALYDLYKDTEIKLARSQKTIAQNSIENPLMVVGNYIFDSIATDVFTVENGDLFEARVSLNTQKGNIKNNKPIDIEKIMIEYNQQAISSNYYNNNTLDSILFNYQQSLTDTHFQFPIAGLNALKNLQNLSNQKLLLLSSDKGYSHLGELDFLDYPELDFHGSFSVMVNYHAIAEFMKQSGGESCVQSFRENIITGVFASGFNFSALSNLKLTIKNQLSGFSPTDYFMIYENFIENFKKTPLDVMASYLNLSAWDPGLFDQVSDQLSELAEKGDSEIVAYLSENMHKIADNFYYLPSCNDILFDIGIFFQNIGNYQEAMKYYDQSLVFFGESDVVSFNMGVCLYSLDQFDKALLHMQNALRLEPSADDTKEWIKTIKKKLMRA